MITVVSHSVGVDYVDPLSGERDRIIHEKSFKRYGLRCKLYILVQMIFEDYVEVYGNGIQ